MSIQVRLAILLGVLLLALLVSLQLLSSMEQNKSYQLTQISLADNRLDLNRWIEIMNRSLTRFTVDFSEWTELADFAANPDPNWAEVNLQQNLSRYEAHAVWIINAQGTVVYSVQANAGPPLNPPLENKDPTQSNKIPHGHSYFAESRDGLLEIWSAKIAPLEPTASGQFRLLTARIWDQKLLARLNTLTGARLSLAPSDNTSVSNPTAPRVDIPLRDAAGTPLRVLQAHYAMPDFAGTLWQDNATIRLLIGFGLCVIFALWLAMRQWVIQPLDLIRESLLQNDPALIQPLLQKSTEMSRMARLVETSFTQKAALESEIAERKQTESALRNSQTQVHEMMEVHARLARDLHDGVIQSIYAAGLGLESAIAQLGKDPAKAGIRLQFCRQNLNEIIREVRAFISGIEPGETKSLGFTQELTTLALTMKSLWPVQINVQVDPQVATRLNSSQELHALQISRECISNAVRHGEATEIEIQLAGDGNSASLTVRDQGQGFDPVLITELGGSGLRNLESRAREMGGTLQINSQPGQGTVIITTFGLSPTTT